MTKKVGRRAKGRTGRTPSAPPAGDGQGPWTRPAATRKPPQRPGELPARTPPERLSTAEHLEAALLRRGMKRSSVRTAILKTFAASEGHLTADDLTARVRETFPRVSPSTVYRTLNTLVDAGLANARAFGDGHSRFEPAGSDHHDHLVCTRCHGVIEFKNDEIERLQDETALRLRFEVTSHRLELYGVCKECRPASGAR